MSLAGDRRMRGREPDQFERTALLGLFVAAVLSVGVVVACLGWLTGEVR